MINIQQAFNLALRQHQAGRVKEARSLYFKILTAQPRNFQAMHMLSRIAYQEGQVNDALELIGKSLALKPDYADAQLDLGNMLLQQGRQDEAAAAYKQAISIKPQWAQPQVNLGTVLRSQGKIAEAIECFRQAIALDPALPEAHHKLGASLHETGQLEGAIASFEKVVALSPKARAYAILGDQYREIGELDRAASAYRQAVALKPDWADVHNSLGEVLRKLGELDAATAAYRQAIAVNPGLAQAHNNLANALKDAGQLEDAIASFQHAAELAPDSAEIRANLGVALQEAGRLDAAELACRAAISLRPDFAEAHNNLAACLREGGRLGESIVVAREAIRLRPDFAIAHFNLAMSLLSGSDLLSGWDEYEWRWKCTEFPSKDRGFPQLLWDGSDLGDRTLLVHAEQGFGDTIQFIRYLPMVAGRGGKIIVECQPQLVRLLQPFSSICRIIGRTDSLPSFDVHCPLLSLPRIFQTTLDSIPADVPYLFPPSEVVEDWRSKLHLPDEQFNIGLAWAGGRTFSSDRTRSLSLDRLAALAAVGGARFYSVQKGYAAAQAAGPPAGMNLIDLSAELNDFVDTAAVITLMDLVITTDTSVAHLAGALGKPTWILLRFAADWRWLEERDDSPWYPSMRLFRQSAPGDWDGVIRQVVGELNTEIRNRPA